MGYRAKHRHVEIATSSVADVAFLLLSFFMMTTVISTEKGLPITLPEWRTQKVEVPVPERNLFKIQINSNDQLLVEGERTSSLMGLKGRIREFILNNGKDKNSSDNAADAIVSLKADRGTSHGMFITVLDEIQGTYYEIYAERTGLSVEAYRSLDPKKPSERLIIDRAKKGIPTNISLAEPTRLDE